MTHEDRHTDPKVDQLLSTIETHAKNVRRQAALLELVDSLAAKVPARHRPLWPYWTGVAAAASIALVLVLSQPAAPQMAMNTAKPTVATVHEDQAIDAASGTPQKAAKEKHSDTNPISAPQPVPAQVLTSPEEMYAYSETESGIRVYCENQCNADEVVAHMEEIVRLSIAAL